MRISDIERRASLVIERRRSKAPPLPVLSVETTHQAVVAHLERRPVPSCMCWHTPYGELRQPGNGSKLRAMGTRAGMPELLQLRAGQLYALKLKSEGGSASDVQRVAMAELTAVGATVGVAYGLDAALAQIAAWGLFY